MIPPPLAAKNSSLILPINVLFSPLRGSSVAEMAYRASSVRHGMAYTVECRHTPLIRACLVYFSAHMFIYESMGRFERIQSPHCFATTIQTVAPVAEGKPSSGSIVDSSIVKGIEMGPVTVAPCIDPVPEYQMRCGVDGIRPRIRIHPGRLNS